MIDVDELQADLDVGMKGNNRPAIGTNAGDLTGVPPQSPKVNRSPCSQLKWLENNTPWHWEAFVTLTFDGGFQGVRITKKSDGSLVKVLRFPITGGADSSPYKQIPINHKRMMKKLVARVVQRLNLTFEE